MKGKKRKYKYIPLSIISLLILTIGIGYVYWRISHSAVDINRYKYPIVGIDISSHNGDIDFIKVRNDSIKFILIKATEGASFKDSAFEHNYKYASESGVAVGIYHFFRFDVNGTLQAKNLLNSIAGKSVNFPIAIDVEEHGNPDTPTGSIVSRLQEMIDCLEEHNIPIMIYTNWDGYNRIYKPHFATYPLWLCRFSEPAAETDWVIWQYSHWCEVDGINGDVDINIFKGGPSDFENWTEEYSFN